MFDSLFLFKTFGMRKIDYLLSEYGESHQNGINKIIHWVCVPLIMFSLIGMLWSVPAQSLTQLLGTDLNGYLTFGSIALLFASFYYLRLSVQLFIGMIVIASLIAVGNKWLSGITDNLFLSSLLIFAFAWVGQFIGHKIEGKKPSFLKDVQFLLIGPAWLLHFLFNKLGIRY